MKNRMMLFLGRVPGERLITPPSALKGDGPLLRLVSDNSIYNVKWVTAFDAPRLVWVGDFARLKTFAGWTRAQGGNGWRMFGGWSRTGFDFRNIGDYYTRVLPDLGKFMGDEGLSGEFDCICDNIPSGAQAQKDHINHCADALAPFLIPVRANEPWKNGDDPQGNPVSSRLPRLMSKGDPPNDAWPYPYVPTLGVSAHHAPRTEDWARKWGKDSYDIRAVTSGVVFNTEGPGFAETQQPWSRVNNEHHAHSAGVGARMFSPGTVAHGDTNTMQLCNVPGPQETLCTRRCFEGVDFVPVEAPTWLYGRYGPSNPGIPMPIEDDVFPAPGRLTDHMHAMIGPNKAIVCNYYPSPGWVAKPANGWRIDKQDEGAVLCSR